MEEQNTKVIKIDAVSTEEILEEMQKRDAIQEISGTAVENEQAVYTEHSKDEHTTTDSKSIYELLEEDIMTSDIPEAEKAKRLSRLIKIRNKQVNIMLVGSTGSGKSSTVNALFRSKFLDMRMWKVYGAIPVYSF